MHTCQPLADPPPPANSCPHFHPDSCQGWWNSDPMSCTDGRGWTVSNCHPTPSPAPFPLAYSMTRPQYSPPSPFPEIWPCCRITKVREFLRLVTHSEADGHLQQKLKQLLKLSKEKWEAACEHAKTAVQVCSAPIFPLHTAIEYRAV